MLQAYTAKVQPRSSAARTEIRIATDLATRHSQEFASLDKIDWEAGDILIALAQDPGPLCWGDNGDVIMEDVKSKRPDFLKLPCLADSNHDISTENGSSSTCSNASESSAISNTSSTSASSGQMSIRHLLGGEHSVDDSSALTSVATPLLQKDNHTYANKKEPATASTSTTHIKKNDWQNRERSDPILLLAAAAAAVNDEDKNYNRRSYERRDISIQPRRSLDFSHVSQPTRTGGLSSKRKYEDNTHRSPPLSRESHRTHERRPPAPVNHATPSTTAASAAPTAQWKHEEEGEASQRSDSAYEWQYLSMKQDPRIKRNAMHAYITYMIYTDMAGERSRTGRKRLRDDPSNGRGSYNYRPVMHERSSPGLDSSITMRQRAPSIAPAPSTVNHYEPPLAASPPSWYANNTASYGMPPSPRQQPQRQTESMILSRPFTAHLWDDTRNDNVVLLPFPTIGRAHHPM